MSRLAFVILRAPYPCCGGPVGDSKLTFRVHLKALESVPRERYARKCPVCGRRWDIMRHTISERPGVRVDRVEWTPIHRPIVMTCRRPAAKS